ncbi:MAG: hypothetical protein GXO62_04465 [Epsilonproteobacteria bacterium]|nr:hypothetical protein [Campylobacterota bacterium]
MKVKLPSLKIPRIVIYGIDVIKNLAFFTLFMIITLLSIALIIAPSIKTFKKYQKIYYEKENDYLSTKATYTKRLKELNKLKRSNAKIIHAFRRKFNQANFKHFASKYMQIVSIEKNATKTYKTDFLTTTYFVKAKIDSPKNFYDFVEALKNYKYLLKVYFPIDFTKDKDKILLTLKIEHYRLKDLKATKSKKTKTQPKS